MSNKKFYGVFVCDEHKSKDYPNYPLKSGRKFRLCQYLSCFEQAEWFTIIEVED